MMRFADSAAGKVKVGGTELLSHRRAIGFTRNLARLGFWAVVLLLTYEWVGFVLGRFPFTRPWGEQLNAFLVTTLVDLLTAIALAMAYPYIPGSGTDAPTRAGPGAQSSEASWKP